MLCKLLALTAVALAVTGTPAPISVVGPLGIPLYNPVDGSQPLLTDPSTSIVAPQNATCGDFTAFVVSDAPESLLFVIYNISWSASNGGQLHLTAPNGLIKNSTQTFISACFACTGEYSLVQATIQLTSQYPAAQQQHAPLVWKMLFTCDSTVTSFAPERPAPRFSNKVKDASDLPLVINGPAGITLFQYGMVDPSVATPQQAFLLPPSVPCATVQFGVDYTSLSTVARDWKYSVSLATSPPNQGTLNLSIPNEGCLHVTKSSSIILGSCNYLRSEDTSTPSDDSGLNYASLCFTCPDATTGTVLVNITLNVLQTQQIGQGARSLQSSSMSFFVKYACGLKHVQAASKQVAHLATSKIVGTGKRIVTSIWDRLHHH